MTFNSLQMFGFDKWMDALTEPWSLATLARKFFMNISLNNRQQTLNLVLFSSCSILVPWFQCTKKEWQDNFFVGVLKAVEIMCWKEGKHWNGKFLLPKGILIYCSIPCCFLPFRIRLLGCPYLEVHKHMLISEGVTDDTLTGSSKWIN